MHREYLYRSMFICVNAMECLYSMQLVETGHRGVGTELDAGGGGGDENGLALTEGHDVLLAVILMVNKAAASGDAHHDHKRVKFREILGARLVQVEERGGEVLAADQFGLGVLDAEYSVL